MAAKIGAVFLLLWLVAGFLLMALDHYVASSVMFAIWGGLYLWSFFQVAE